MKNVPTLYFNKFKHVTRASRFLLKKFKYNFIKWTFSPMMGHPIYLHTSFLMFR